MYCHKSTEVLAEKIAAVTSK